MYRLADEAQELKRRKRNAESSKKSRDKKRQLEGKPLISKVRKSNMRGDIMDMNNTPGPSRLSLPESTLDFIVSTPDTIEEDLFAQKVSKDT
ncbi:hypothetical protein BDP27DRAFT_1446200 [Rhodocollybia butyracea]|uniref:BZIP domain-containing protein n=1 Tax=Rhodocollybia butyracea TaxID=206335 RepID=A0A9P5Q0L5_9AGAR|nr:hypothetical protein BDP27DRAFT_1446200 [Rhodocollybia butyracea]